MAKTIIVKKGVKTPKSKQTYKKWTKAEVNYLKNNYKFKSNLSLAKALGRTIPSVAIKAKSLGLTGTPAPITPSINTKTTVFKSKKVKQNGWSKKEISFLKENYGKLSVAEIAKELNRSAGSITGKAYWLNISFKAPNKRSHRAWSNEEVKYLKENYGKKSYKVMAKYLKRSFDSVASKLNEIKAEMPKVKELNKKVAPTPKVKKSSNWAINTLVIINVLTLSALTYLLFIR